MTKVIKMSQNSSTNQVKNFFEKYVWGMFASPSNHFKIFLRILPFILAIVGYSVFSAQQTALDPKQKVYPSISKMIVKFQKYTFEPNRQIVSNQINAKKKEVDLKNEEIQKQNEIIAESNKLNNESKAYIPLLEKPKENAYKDWKKIKKEIKKVDKKIKALPETASFSEKTTLLVDKYTLKFEAAYIGFFNSALYHDTVSSLSRLGISMGIASSFALIVGIYMGTYKLVEYTLKDFTTMFSLIQPVAIMPVIMIIFGVEDFGKIIFIILGVLPTMLLTLSLKVKDIPIQTIVKSKTLGASDFQTIRKVVFPQILPHFLDTVRLTLFFGWLLLLTSETVPTESGLGYRIVVEKRFANMDIIIPYIVWIVFISYLLDRSIAILQKVVSPWYKTR
jgi:NitT/TauT family transport system permease protein